LRSLNLPSDNRKLSKNQRNLTPTVGCEETEMNYVIMGFIVGVIILAVSDSIRA